MNANRKRDTSGEADPVGGPGSAVSVRFLEVMSDAAVLVDTEMRILAANTAAAARLGVGAARDLVGREASSWLTEDEEAARVFLRRSARGELGPVFVRVAVRVPAGERKVDLRITPFAMGAEGPRSYLVTAPGTALVPVQAANGQVALMDLLRKAARIGAWSHELMEDRVVTVIEPVLARAGEGHELEQLIRTPERWLEPESAERWRLALARARSAGVPWDLVIQYRQTLGRPLWVRTMGFAHWLSGQVVSLHGILQDVTMLREVERQLLQAQKLEALTRMTPGIAHDLRNVLTAIAGFGACAAELLPPTHPAQDDLAGLAQAVEQGAKLTRQLVAIARDDPAQPEELDVSMVLGEIYSLLRRALGETVSIDMVHATRLGRVFMDRGQLEQVILNLALNARDAMPFGGTLTLSTDNVEATEPLRTLTGLRPAGSFVELAVRDTGVGMDPITRSRLFEPFFTTKPAGQGSGLGLSSCQRIAERAGGFIDVESTPAVGTTVRVWLPTRGGAAEDRPRSESGSGRR